MSNIKERIFGAVTVMSAYKSGDPDYQPSVSQEDLLKELNLK